MNQDAFGQIVKLIVSVLPNAVPNTVIPVAAMLPQPILDNNSSTSGLTMSDTSTTENENKKNKNGKGKPKDDRAYENEEDDDDEAVGL